MKHLLLVLVLSLLFSLCYNITEAQTYQNIASPENVLVVYNPNYDSSEYVMNYYVNARNIPSSNVLPLALPMVDTLNLNDGTGNHIIKIVNHAETIQDYTWAIWDSTHTRDSARFHAWQYFLDTIASPIRNYIQNNNLSSTIKYIVLCRGIPYKIQARGDWSVPGNYNVDGLLCMLNTPNYNNFIRAIFDYYMVMGGVEQEWYNTSPFLLNPYFNMDQTNYTLDYRFNSDSYSRTWSTYTYKLSYLVSRLDALSVPIIENVVDKSVDADKSGKGIWVIDNDPKYNYADSDFSNANTRLSNLGFQTSYDSTSDTWITHASGKVMGYTSHGDHAEDGNCNWHDSTFIQDSLKFFTLAKGSIFNTYESYNGRSIASLTRGGGETPPPGCNHTQGLMTEWLLIGGTGGTGHSWEPWADYVMQSGNYFPSYAVGYSQVDAAYLGIPYLAWRNVVVGDPLTTIAWGKQTLMENISLSSTACVTGVITIPDGKDIFLMDSCEVNFLNGGFITGSGYVLPQGYFDFQLQSWDKSLFKSYENNNPRIIWGAYPGSGTVSGYKIYRKYLSDRFTNIAQVNSGTFSYTDTTMEVDTTASALYPAYYYITPIVNGREQSASNTINFGVDGELKNNGLRENNMYHYELSQNYPNPFNPTTTLSYTIEKAGYVSLNVYDILGRVILPLVNEHQNEGRYSINCDLSNLPSGVYFYRLSTGQFNDTKKMLLVR